MNARERTELVVALNKERVVWAVERKADGAPPSATSLFGSSGTSVNWARLGPARHRREGEQVDTALGEGSDRTRYAAPTRHGRSRSSTRRC